MSDQQQPTEKPAVPESTQEQQQQARNFPGQRYPRNNTNGTRNPQQQQPYQKGNRQPNKPYNNYQGGNKYNNKGYHHKNSRNAANMQWGYNPYMMAQGQYFNPYAYGYVPQVPNAVPNQTPVQGSPAPSTDSSVSPQIASSASTTPVSKKIEITNRSGEHVDLNAIHSQHIKHPDDESKKEETKKEEKEEVPSPAVTITTAAAAAAAAAATVAPTAPEPSKEVVDIKEQMRLAVLERARKRKEEEEKKKAAAAAAAAAEEEAKNAVQEPVSEEPKKEEPVLEEPKKEELVAEEPAAEKPVAEEPVAEEPVTEEPVTEEPVSQKLASEEPVAEVPEKKQESASEEPAKLQEEEETVSKQSEKEEEPARPLTFAEKLRLKKAAEAKTKEEPSTDISNASVVPENEESPVKTEETVKVEDESKAEASNAEDEVSTVSEKAKLEEEVAHEESKKEEQQEEQQEDVDDGRLTMTELLDRLKQMPPVEDLYSFEYPEGVEAPEERFKKETVKYTYGPTFLLQFKEKVDIRPDAEWKKNVASKIVIPPGMGRSGGRPRGNDFKFGPGSNFKKSGSLRNMEGRSNSRSSSKRKSKRGGDDRRSNRSYTSRKDRERMAEHGEDREFEKPKEEVVPLVPSANRWVPKSRVKKVEVKLAPDGVTELLGKEEAERRMKSLLNKLTLEKFETISEDIIQIANQSKWEEQGETLKVAIEQIFLKACDEPHWSSMYAQLCGKVVKDLDPEISDEENEGKTGPKLVLHYLVDRCHTEFQKGWSDKLPPSDDGSSLEPEMMSDEYYRAAAAKRRGLGLVRFIGFLYRSNLLTPKMMFECFRRLMKDLADSPSEDTLESVVELLNTVGEQLENDKLVQPNGTLEGSTVLDQLFYMLDNIIEEDKISSRIKFKLIDMKELREVKNWNSANKDDGPKTIQQIHEEEAAKKLQEERDRKMRNSSRSGSRRNNGSHGGSMGNRSGSIRNVPPPSRDSFIATRSSSLRHAQAAPKEEAATQQTSTNMFDALMGADSDDDE